MTGSTPRIPNHQRNIKVVYLHLRYRSPRSYFWPFFILFFRRMDYYGMRPVLLQMLWCRGYYLMWKLETGFCWNSLFACDMWILNSFCLVTGESCDHTSLHFPLFRHFIFTYFPFLAEGMESRTSKSCVIQVYQIVIFGKQANVLSENKV